MLRRPGRLATFLAVAASASLLVAASAQAASSSEQQLVSAYAPVLKLRAQEDPPCTTTEEQYAPPTSVDVVLGIRGVTLLQYVGGEDVRVKDAPTAARSPARGTTTTSTCPGTLSRPVAPTAGTSLR